LERPLSTLAQDPAGIYGNRVDYLRDLGRTRGQLAELQAIVDAQIPIERQNLEALKNLPVALFPNFESIVTAIGTTSGDTAALLSQANAAIDAAIAAMAARDEAMRQSIREITPAVREIPPYVENVYTGIVTQTNKIDAMLAQMVSDSAILFAKMDTDSNNMVTKAEFMAQLSGKSTDAKLQMLWNGLDINHDGLLSATELIPFQIATNLSGYFNTLDANTDGLLTFTELKTGLNGLATDTQIRQLISAVDTNGDGMISMQEASYFQLNNINESLINQRNTLSALHGINEESYLIQNNTYAARNNLINIELYTYRSMLNLNAISKSMTGVGYATGGISTGPLSGYPATLHGREAVIPLGDGNSITAYLREPEPPPNYIRQEAGDTQALRQALAELQQEIAALRRDGQTIGASTIGELKEHNRRERRRDVNGTLVEVMS
jgi:Ca2+-binding EF-hand superfamily protein